MLCRRRHSSTGVTWQLLVAEGSSFLVRRWLIRFAGPIHVLDAAGLSLFAVTGAGKALALGVGPAQAVLFGCGDGGRWWNGAGRADRRVPSVLSRGLYAIPALVGAALVVLVDSRGVHHVLGAPVALGAAGVCFEIRIVGLLFSLDAPKPPGADGRRISGR